MTRRVGDKSVVWCLPAQVRVCFQRRESSLVPNATEGSTQLGTEKSPVILHHGGAWGLRFGCIQQSGGGGELDNIAFFFQRKERNG